MSSVSLTVHSFEIGLKAPGNLVIPRPLGDYNGQGGNMLDFTVRLLRKLVSTAGKNAGNQVFAEIEQVFDDGVDQVYGTMKTGGYGRGGTIVDVDTTKVTHKKRKREAELLPYYFRIYAPPGGKKGILVAQKIGHRSLTPIFDKFVAGEFRKANPGYSLKFARVVPTQLLRRYLQEGELKRVEVRFDHLPVDVFDEYYDPSTKGDRLKRSARLKQIIEAERGKELVGPKWVQQIRDGGSFPEQVEMFGVEVDEASVEVTFGGKRRRVVVSDFAQFRGSIDISDSVLVDDDNIPTFNSVNAEAKDILASIRIQERV